MYRNLSDEEKIGFVSRIFEKGLESFLLNLGVSKMAIESSKITYPSKDPYVVGATEEILDKSSFLEVFGKTMLIESTMIKGSGNFGSLDLTWFDIMNLSIFNMEELNRKNIHLRSDKMFALLYSLETNGLENFAKSFADNGSSNVGWGCYVKGNGSAPHEVHVLSNGNHRAIMAKVLGLDVRVSLKYTRFFKGEG